jgi:predicted metal-dependent hydrolase
VFKAFRPKPKRKSPARPVLIGQDSISLEGKTIPFTLKRSFRAKLLWLTFKPESGLQVTVPQRYNLTKLPDFLRHNSGWILRHQFCPHIQSEMSPATRTSG